MNVRWVPAWACTIAVLLGDATLAHGQHVAASPRRMRGPDAVAGEERIYGHWWAPMHVLDGTDVRVMGAATEADKLEGTDGQRVQSASAGGPGARPGAASDGLARPATNAGDVRRTSPPDEWVGRDDDGDTCPAYCEAGSKPGRVLRYEVESVEVRGNVRTSDRVVLGFVKYHTGSILDADDPELELLRYRLLATGFFKAVSLSLRKGRQPGQVVLTIDVVERNTLVISDIWLGLSANADTQGNARPLSAYAGVDAAETNLLGSGVTVGSGFGFAQDQFALRTRVFVPSLFATRAMLSGTIQYNNALEMLGNRDVQYTHAPTTTVLAPDYAPARNKRMGGTLGLGTELTSTWQGWFEYRLERLDATLPLAASHRRGRDIEPIDFGLARGLSVLSTLKLSFSRDTRDNPVLPTRGSLTSAMTEVAVAPLGSDYEYQKHLVAWSHWFPLACNHVVRLGVFGGVISGTAPIHERFYVGDLSDLLPSRMLGLTVDRRPAHNMLGTVIREIRYGTYAGKVYGEYRVPLYRSQRSIYGIDFFGLAGVFALADKRDLSNPPTGYSGFARVPVDLTFNLGIQIDSSVGGFSFAFSNILGFLPVRREATP